LFKLPRAVIKANAIGTWLLLSEFASCNEQQQHAIWGG
jgi:hypothetical protein